LDSLPATGESVRCCWRQPSGGKKREPQQAHRGSPATTHSLSLKPRLVELEGSEELVQEAALNWSNCAMGPRGLANEGFGQSREIARLVACSAVDCGEELWSPAPLLHASPPAS